MDKELDLNDLDKALESGQLPNITNRNHNQDNEEAAKIIKEEEDKVNVSSSGQTHHGNQFNVGINGETDEFENTMQSNKNLLKEANAEIESSNRMSIKLSGKEAANVAT